MDAKTQPARLGPLQRMQVKILNDDDIKTFADRLTALINFNKHSSMAGATKYCEHFVDELTFPSDEGVGTKIYFVIMLPFAFFNAICPPPNIAGGWPTFVLSLCLVSCEIRDPAAFFAWVGAVCPNVHPISVS